MWCKLRRTFKFSAKKALLFFFSNLLQTNKEEMKNNNNNNNDDDKGGRGTSEHETHGRSSGDVRSSIESLGSVYAVEDCQSTRAHT